MSEQEALAGRPRDPAIDDAILRATQDLLIERGVAGTTMDAVARAAGSGKAAVYRRWPSKTDLTIAAVKALYDPPPIPETGSLRGDLLACAVHYARDDRRALLVLRSILSELANDAELAKAAYEAIGSPPARVLDAVLERWTARGEIPMSAPVDLAGSILPSLAFTSTMLGRQTLDAESAERIVDQVLLPVLLGRGKTISGS